MDKTGIEWTDATWNVLRGCTRVSDGCTRCYAETMASRFSGPGLPYEGVAKDGRWTGKIRFVEDKLDQPLRWRRPRRIFVNSMSDLFHEKVSEEWLARIFGIMAAARRHSFQILTKRPQRMLDWVGGVCATGQVFPWYVRAGGVEPDGSHIMPWPLPNVWLGVSVEDQKTADERIPLLLQTPAAVRWISAEPLLGPVNIEKYCWPTCWSWDAKYESPEKAVEAGAFAEKKPQALVSAARVFLNWIVVGGESGPGARPMHPDWARSLRDQCVEAGTPFLFKQWGDWGFDKSKDIDSRKLQHRIGKKKAGRELDGKIWDEYPKEAVTA